jgi:phage tail sheath protein FI
MDYLHGIEIKETPKTIVLAAGDTAIIGLVGTAPQGVVDTPVLITNLAAGFAAFGEDIGGFTIPAALGVIFNRVNAKVIVINVLANADAAALIDEATGKMTVDIDGNWATGIGKAALPETADYAAEIIAGIEKMLDIENTLGLKPNILIAPGYSQIAAVLAKMDSVAIKLNGFAVVDVAAETVTAALEARATGTYATASAAIVLCFPRAIRYNSHEKGNQPCALSVFWAAAKASRDAVMGYWVSPSNSELTDILSTDVLIRSSLTDPAADTNLLNAKGIVTLFRRAGSGYRIWGNWTAAFPTEITADVMIAPRAVRMAIREALIDASVNYLDITNINKVGIDMILDSVNAFIRNLVGTGVLNQGSECAFDSDKNTPDEVAQGHLTFTLTEVFAPSLDKLTFEEVIDLTALTF